MNAMHTSDPLLLYLVGNFELLAKDGLKTPKFQLELYIGGSVMIGELISSIEYEKESHRVTKVLLKIRENTVDEVARLFNVSHADIEGKVPEFLHMRDVEIWPHNLSQNADGPSRELWRVRISSVDAFHISDVFEMASDLKSPT
jgi:hypothetical protein